MSIARLIDRHGDLIAAVAVGLVAFAARFHGLGDKPYWLDELLTLRRADHDAATVVIDSLRNHHLPTYFLLIAAILPVGMNEAVVRLPSAVFGALSASLVCSISNRLAGRSAGLIGGLLMAFSPFQVQMGQEARSYAMVTCLILLGLWGLIRVLDDAAQLDRSRADMRTGWIAYFCGTAGALLVLPIAIPWFAAANLGVIALALKGFPQRAGFLRRWLAVQAAVAVVAAPGLIALAFIGQGSFVHAFDWIPPPSLSSLKAAAAATYLLRITDVASFDLLPIDVPGLGVIAVAAAALGAWKLRHAPHGLLIVGLAALALPVTLLGISLVKSVAIPRYFAWGAGPFFVFAGAALAAMSRRVQIAGCSAVMVLSVLNLAPYYQAETKPRWDLAVRDIGTRLRSDDVILAADPWVPYMLSAFAERQALGPMVTVTQSVEDAAGQLAAGHRVWAVYGRVGQGRMKPFDAFRTRIAVLGSAAIEMDEGRHIHVLRFDPAAIERLSDVDDASGLTPE